MMLFICTKGSDCKVWPFFHIMSMSDCDRLPVKIDQAWSSETRARASHRGCSGFKSYVNM